MGITKREQRRESLLLYPRLGHVVLPILDPGPKFMVFSSFLDAITSKYPNVDAPSSLHLGLHSQPISCFPPSLSNEVPLGAICKLSSCDDVNPLFKSVI